LNPAYFAECIKDAMINIFRASAWEFIWFCSRKGRRRRPRASDGRSDGVRQAALT